jgi:hypothetical protein
MTENVMRMRLVVTATLALIATSAPAEAPKSSSAQPAQPQPDSKVVVLASAEAVKSASGEAAQPTPAAPRRRIARVTHCRCGDPQPGEVSDDSSEQ